MKPATKKTLSSVQKAVHKQKVNTEKVLHKLEHKMTPHNKVVRYIYEMWLAVEQRLRNK